MGLKGDDKDILLSGEDILAIRTAEKEEREGKLISLEELKKKLNLGEDVKS